MKASDTVKNYNYLQQYCKDKVGSQTFVPDDEDRFTAQAEISFKAGWDEGCRTGHNEMAKIMEGDKKAGSSKSNLAAIATNTGIFVYPEGGLASTTLSGNVTTNKASDTVMTDNDVFDWWHLNHSGDPDMNSPEIHRQAQAEISFRAGIKEGITLFAWWKDGVQYVGTCGMTLKQALAEIEVR